MRIKPTTQDYTAYTAEDFKVWHLLFERQMELLQTNASKLYLQAVGHIGFNADEIPDFKKTNQRLQSLTGWQLTVVPELVPQQEFFTLLAQRIFPATCWLRTMDELDYLEEPDMFHDVFGHAPLLTNVEYADFMQDFGKLAVKWQHEPEAISLLSRVYWYTIEFGLLSEDDRPSIFGAGIISSIGETRHALNGQVVKRKFDIATMLATEYHTDVIQENYFVIDSFSELCHALPHIDALISAVLQPQLS